MWCVPEEGAESVVEALLLRWSWPVVVTTVRLKGPAALLWDSCGGMCADLGGSNFTQAERSQENV